MKIVLQDTLSAAEAAAHIKADKATVIRAIHTGKIDGAFKNEFGDWRIPPNGLQRYRRRNPHPTDEALLIQMRKVKGELSDLAIALEQRISE